MENNKKDFEIQESNAAKRMKGLGEDMNEKIHSKEDEITKGDFWGNLWYRYKWVIIIGSILLVIAVVLIVQIAMKKDDDIKIAYAGPEYLAFDSTKSSIESVFSVLATDYNNDGNLIINFNSNVILNSEQVAKKEVVNEEMTDGVAMGADQKYQNQLALNNFSTQMMSGDFAIYLIDPLLYKENFQGLFRNMSEALNMEIPEEIKYDDYAVYLKKTEFGKYYKGLDSVPDDTVVLLLNKTYLADEDEYANSIDFLKKLITFKAPK